MQKCVLLSTKEIGISFHAFIELKNIISGHSSATPPSSLGFRDYRRPRSRERERRQGSKRSTCPATAASRSTYAKQNMINYKVSNYLWNPQLFGRSRILRVCHSWNNSQAWRVSCHVIAPVGDVACSLGRSKWRDRAVLDSNESGRIWT